MCSIYYWSWLIAFSTVTHAAFNPFNLSAAYDAAKRQLTGTKTLAYSFDFDVEPWVINLESEWYETYGATGVEEVGESSKLVLNAVEYARPLGVKVNHIMTNNV